MQFSHHNGNSFLGVGNIKKNVLQVALLIMLSGGVTVGQAPYLAFDMFPTHLSDFKNITGSRANVFIQNLNQLEDIERIDLINIDVMNHEKGLALTLFLDNGVVIQEEFIHRILGLPNIAKYYLNPIGAYLYKDGRLMEVEHFGNNNENVASSSYEYEYDSDGYLLEVRHYFNRPHFPDTCISQPTTRYKYDLINNEIEVLYLNFQCKIDSDLIETKREVYSYNESGKIESVTEYSLGIKTFERAIPLPSQLFPSKGKHCTHVFDDYDNWIERECVFHSFKNIEERKITYKK